MLNYLYGFLLTIFILVLILVMANKLMVRYLDRGAMAVPAGHAQQPHAHRTAR